MSETPNNSAAFDLVSGDVVDMVRQLELFSRFRVEGFLLGQNASPFKGFSADFLQHRQYFPGDNLKYLDWRVYGKTERLYVREYEELTNTRVSILLDVSNSMGYQADEAKHSKHAFSLRCAALIAYMAFLRKDSISLTTFNTEVAQRVGFGSGRGHLQRILRMLVAHDASGGTDFANGLGNAAAPITRKGLTVVLSDCMDDPEHIVRIISRLRHQGSDVILMQVFDPAEASFDFGSVTRFHDLESDDIVVLDPQLLVKEWRKLFEQHQVDLKEACLRHGFDHTALPVSDEYEVPLLEYVRKRMELCS